MTAKVTIDGLSGTMVLIGNFSPSSGNVDVVVQVTLSGSMPIDDQGTVSFSDAVFVGTYRGAGPISSFFVIPTELPKNGVLTLDLVRGKVTGSVSLFDGELSIASVLQLSVLAAHFPNNNNEESAFITTIDMQYARDIHQGTDRKRSFSSVNSGSFSGWSSVVEEIGYSFLRDFAGGNNPRGHGPRP